MYVFLDILKLVNNKLFVFSSDLDDSDRIKVLEIQ